MSDTQAKQLGVVLFPGFETLDVFGPVEMFGHLQGVVDTRLVAQTAGPVTSAQGPAAVAAHGFADAPAFDLLLIPGGIGTYGALAWGAGGAGAIAGRAGCPSAPHATARLRRGGIRPGIRPGFQRGFPPARRPKVIYSDTTTKKISIFSISILPFCRRERGD